MENNIFFHNSVTQAVIYAWLRKNVDIIPALRHTNTEQGNMVVSLDDNEIKKFVDTIRNTKDYYMAGEEDIQIVGTTIVIPAIIVDKI